jgi:hypothetical protein
MISKDQSIVTQVAAKIAAELIIKTEDTSKNVAEWLTAFDAVNEALQGAHAVAVIKDVFPGATEVKPQFTATTTTTTASGGLAIAGQQHGDIPGWLTTACAKAGVTKVWDNRDTAVGTKRPWFKSADGSTNEKGEPFAFWPPKGA